jgi:hypothetical protein
LIFDSEIGWARVMRLSDPPWHCTIKLMTHLRNA